MSPGLQLTESFFTTLTSELMSLGIKYPSPLSITSYVQVYSLLSYIHPGLPPLISDTLTVYVPGALNVIPCKPNSPDDAKFLEV